MNVNSQNQFRQNFIQQFQVVLVSGGESNEIFPLTDKFSKQLLPIVNKPLIAYQLEYLENNDIQEVIILHKQSNQLERYLNEEYKGRIKREFVYFQENNQKSTVEQLKEIWNKINRDFIVINGASLTDFNLDELTNVHILKESTITMLCKQQEILPDQKKKSKEVQEDLEIFAIDNNTNRILQIVSKDEADQDGIPLKKAILSRHPNITLHADLLDCQIYVFKYNVIEFLKSTHRKFMSIKYDLIPFIMRHQYNNRLKQELFQQNEQNAEDGAQLEIQKQSLNLKTQKQEIGVYAHLFTENYFQRIDSLLEYQQANIDYFPNQQSLCFKLTQNNEKTDQNNFQSQAVISDGTLIGEKVMITKSIIGRNCVIKENCKIANSVIMNNTIIENDCIIQNSVIGMKAVIGQKSKIKEYSTIAHNATVPANSQLTGEEYY